MISDVPKDLVSAAQSYENLFVPSLFETWTKHLVEGANVKEGSHVLDVACGTGVLARSALARVGTSGHVVGADPAPGMLAVARDIEPAIDWILCSAEALDVGDGVFDCVISQFGMMFFDDKKKSIAEMFRSMKSGGSLAIAIWRSVQHNPAYAELISVLENQAGTDAGDALRLPFSLGNADEIVALLRDNCFSEITIEVKTESATFPSLNQMVEAELRGWLPMCGIHLGESKISDVLLESDKALGKYVGSTGAAAFPTSANIFTARKL